MDGTDKLCKVLYGRDPRPADYLGGADAHMLHDAADLLENLALHAFRAQHLVCIPECEWDGAWAMAGTRTPAGGAPLQRPSETPPLHRVGETPPDADFSTGEPWLLAKPRQALKPGPAAKAEGEP